MGLQIGLGEDLVRLALADPDRLSQRPDRPVRLTARRLRARGLEHLHPLVVVIHRRLARPRKVLQPIQPMLSEPVAPHPDLALRQPHLPSDPPVRNPVRRSQHHPRAGHHPLLTTRRAHDRLKRRPLRIGQFDLDSNQGHDRLHTRRQCRARIRRSCRNFLDMNRRQPDKALVSAIRASRDAPRPGSHCSTPAARTSAWSTRARGRPRLRTPPRSPTTSTRASPTPSRQAGSTVSTPTSSTPTKRP